MQSPNVFSQAQADENTKAGRLPLHLVKHVKPSSTNIKSCSSLLKKDSKTEHSYDDLTLDYLEVFHKGDFETEKHKLLCDARFGKFVFHGIRQRLSTINWAKLFMDKPKEEKKDSFAEKLATQIIKNLQIKITSIHVRYEDAITDPSRPISVGVTLGELSLQTADENWTPCILSDTAKIIYKLVRLDCLCGYWNVNSLLFCGNTREQILLQLKEGIASSADEPKNHDYIFKPISASAKLCINPSAETELNSPKINLDVEVQSIDIEMTKPQYLSIIDLLESVDYMVRNVHYRKYKPNVPLHKNANKW
ncbi:intermembrane lipid transfer protein VPS13C-like [Rhincodon typus]|uniref:intermembrane lipid transfer protein VPS13C-like n=1 Tax=Rhincodon typus TaxID=259920 RepID=UPI00202E8E0F|nr:intermembrane lipid transfer protein VPS13C-like [Rhincodon typus]